MIPRMQKRPGQRGFTTLELLVVLLIISVLVGLVAVAVFPLISGQSQKNTETLLRKLHEGVQQQWSEASKQYRNLDSSSLLYNYVLPNLAGGDPARAQVICLKLLLRREFPMSYAEIQRPGMGIIPDTDLPPISSYVAAIQNRIPVNTNSNGIFTESAACLLIALQNHPHKGMKFNAEETLGASAIRDTDNDGVPEIVDGWGKPIAFFRWGTGNPDLNALARNARGNLDRDTEDPFHKLMDTSWQSNYPQAVVTFQSLCHSITGTGGGPQSYFTIPVVVSAGKDGKFGLPNSDNNPPSPTMTPQSPDANDNIYSFQVR
ncbi:MAG: prepilin-type N-terminal cleavage/methylation domain-containing protein [Planctomycetes bacterium]|nr:prepilin-type N-terminal cleavage/methylation domain-containing protein [Planctomycetota bacterium]